MLLKILMIACGINFILTIALPYFGQSIMFQSAGWLVAIFIGWGALELEGTKKILKEAAENWRDLYYEEIIRGKGNENVESDNLST